MKKLLCIFATLLVLLMPACNAGIKLELGTMAISSHLEVDEWAQANVLKALDELLAKDENAKDSDQSLKEAPSP